MNFCPMTVIEGQVLADFIAEFTYSNATEVAGTANNIGAVKVARAREGEDSASVKGDAEQWTLYIDDASNNTGFRTGMMLISPEGHKIHCALRFGFKALNNEAKYEAFIAGLCLTRELQACSVKIFSDS